MRPYYTLEEVSRLPHLLIGGAVGQGGYEFLRGQTNALLDEGAQIVVVDPSGINFSHLDGHPRLAIPRAITPEECLSAIEWVNRDMNRRFRSVTSMPDGYFLHNYITERLKFPRLILIIDNLEDVLSSTDETVAKLLIRIGAMGRGAAIHLLANIHAGSIDLLPDDLLEVIPARVAFRCASEDESLRLIETPHAANLPHPGAFLSFVWGREVKRGDLALDI